MVNVIAFPPIGATGSEWTVSAPLQVSRSLMTGRRYVSAWGRERREASVMLSALARNRSGAGYSEMLKRHLKGGEHLVRLNSYPINWHLDAARMEGLINSHPFTWEHEDATFAWEHEGNPVIWFSGTVLTGTVTTSGGWPALAVSGLPPNTLVARPGDFVEAFEEFGDTTGHVAQVTAEATSNGAGSAIVRLLDALPELEGVRVNLGASDSRVFEAVEMPRSAQPIGANWFYDWRFREVFADEVDGFTEVNPWS
jgi:hypothetical protein